MSDIELKAGERVRIIIENALVRYPDSPYPAYVIDGILVNLPTRLPSVTVEHVAPAEWPPQPGDLWRDRHGGLWFATDVHDIEETDEPEVLMVWTHENYRQTPDEANQRRGPLTLVHRDQADGEDKA